MNRVSEMDKLTKKISMSVDQKMMEFARFRKT